MYAQLVRLAGERRREMLDDARQQRPVRLRAAFLRASRRAERAERRMHRAYRAAARLGG